MIANIPLVFQTMRIQSPQNLCDILKGTLTRYLLILPQFKKDFGQSLLLANYLFLLQLWDHLNKMHYNFQHLPSTIRYQEYF